MAEANITALEPCWRELDVQWLALNLSEAVVQGIHDLNFGYGDPLRTKARWGAQGGCISTVPSGRMGSLLWRTTRCRWEPILTIVPWLRRLSRRPRC